MASRTWNPIKLEYSAICETKEQFELFVSFVKNMKIKKEEWSRKQQIESLTKNKTTRKK